MAPGGNDIPARYGIILVLPLDPVGLCDGFESGEGGRGPTGGRARMPRLSPWPPAGGWMCAAPPARLSSTTRILKRGLHRFRGGGSPRSTSPPAWASPAPNPSSWPTARTSSCTWRRRRSWLRSPPPRPKSVDTAAWLQRELDVVSFLAGAGIPVLEPSPEIPGNHLPRRWPRDVVLALPEVSRRRAAQRGNRRVDAAGPARGLAVLSGQGREWRRGRDARARPAERHPGFPGPASRPGLPPARPPPWPRRTPGSPPNWTARRGPGSRCTGTLAWATSWPRTPDGSGMTSRTPATGP